METNQALHVERVVISGLVLDPANVRVHPERNLEAIKGSLARFGQQKPVVVGKNGVVIAGNGTLQAAKDLGWTEIDIVRSELEGIEATAYAIADNRTAELAEWDETGLAKLIRDLDAEDAVEGLGFDDDEIRSMVATLEIEERGDLDDAGPEEPIEKPTSKRGDLWILGEHRLLCGDSTSVEDVDRLMAGEKAALVATDPPYLVDYTGERPNDTGKDWSRDYREVEIEDADAFFRSVFANVIRVLGPGAAVYCWHAHKRAGEIQRIWRDLGLIDHQQIIWVKPTPVFGRVYWHFRHEPCVMGWLQGSKPEHDGNHDFDSVWEIDWEGKARVVGNEHPTQKPIEIFARPMRKHTKPGALVFEPFSGSGSQLIAAEKEGRRCRAMEISPAFVDAAIRRWQRTTGKDAVLAELDRTYAEVSEMREQP